MNTAAPKKLVKAQALRKGDRVGLICPASRPESPAVLKRCVSLVEEMGFKPVVGKSAMATHGYMAGTDAQRLEDLHQFLYDDSIAAIFCVSGGFGSLHLVPDIDYAFLTKHPKVLVGSDDNTGWLTSVYTQSGLVSLHGPNLDRVGDKHTFERLREAVMSNRVLPPISCRKSISEDLFSGFCYAPVAGTTSGALLGGNLTALISLMGTPFQLELANSILFLEDRGERNDILDRWFTTLYISNQLASVKGVAFGQFENCSPQGHGNMLSLEDLFGDRLMEMGKPCCFGMPIGQGKSSATVPLGVNVQFDSGRGLLEFTESALH